MNVCYYYHYYHYYYYYCYYLYISCLLSYKYSVTLSFYSLFSVSPPFLPSFLPSFLPTPIHILKQPYPSIISFTHP